MILIQRHLKHTLDYLGDKMADGPGFNVNLPAQLAEIVGDFQGAAKSIKSELRELDRQARELKKTGREIPSDLEGRRETLRDEHDRLLRKAEDRKNTSTIDKSISEAVKNIDKVQALPRQLKRIASGDVNVGDISSVGSGIRTIGTKLAERGFLGTGTALAKSGQVISAAAANPITMIATEVIRRSIGAMIKESDAVSRVNERQYNYLLDQHQSLVGAGTVTEAKQLSEFRQKQERAAEKAEDLARSNASALVWESIFGESSEVKEAGLNAAEREKRLQQILQYGLEPQISNKIVRDRLNIKLYGSTGAEGDLLKIGRNIATSRITPMDMIFGGFRRATAALTGKTQEEYIEEMFLEEKEQYKEELYQSLINTIKNEQLAFQSDSKRVVEAEKYKSFTGMVEKDRLARMGDWMPY